MVGLQTREIKFKPGATYSDGNDKCRVFCVSEKEIDLEYEGGHYKRLPIGKEVWVFDYAHADGNVILYPFNMKSEAGANLAGAIQNTFSGLEFLLNMDKEGELNVHDLKTAKQMLREASAFIGYAIKEVDA